MGPLKGRRDESAHVNFTHADRTLGCAETKKGVDTIQYQLEHLYNVDFRESVVESKD